MEVVEEEVVVEDRSINEDASRLIVNSLTEQFIDGSCYTFYYTFYSYFTFYRKCNRNLTGLVRDLIHVMRMQVD